MDMNNMGFDWNLLKCIFFIHDLGQELDSYIASGCYHYKFRKCKICSYCTDGTEAIGGKFNDVQVYRAIIGFIIVNIIFTLWFGIIPMLIAYGFVGLVFLLIWLSGR